MRKIINIKVKTNSKQFLVDGSVVHVKSPPKDNKANIEIIKGLSKYFNAKVRIISGRTSKRKKIEIY